MKILNLIDVDLLIAILSFCTALVLGIIQYWQGIKVAQRDEQWRSYMIRTDVMRFCQKYNERLDDFYLGELSCLSLCAVAFSVEPDRAYGRSIYRDFCCLSVDVVESLLQKYRLSLLFSSEMIDVKGLTDYGIEKIKAWYPEEEIADDWFFNLRVLESQFSKERQNVRCEIDSDICDQLGIERNVSGEVSVELGAYIEKIFDADFITNPFSRIVCVKSASFGLDSIRQGYLFAMALQYFLKDIVGFSSECSQIWKGTSCHKETYEDVALKTFLAIRLSQLSKRRLR